MNNTYIMGNGFDLNLGLKTRYEDFYRWYVNKPKVGEPDVVGKFKRVINDYIKGVVTEANWSNLETVLGQYTIKVPKNQFHTFYFDVVDSLKDYLMGDLSYYTA